MRASELISAVQESAGIPTREGARRAFHATLQALGDRLDDGQPQALAARLPSALAVALPEQGAGERFGVEEFYRRVAGYEAGGCTPGEARRHARAVTAALRGGLNGKGLDRVAAQLPEEYADLLGGSVRAV